MPPDNYVFAALVAAVMFGGLAASELLARGWIELDGRVISSDTTCQQPHNNRCVTRYSLERRDGSQVIYDAASNDHSLWQRLPVGAVISKRRWELGYSVDGNQINDFPRYFYGGTLAAAGCIAVVSLIRHIIAPQTI
jgi:hypothetical protein